MEKCGEDCMIRVTRLNHEPIVVNADLIEYIETTPDTVISLTTGEKFMVLESPDEVVTRAIEFGRQLHQKPERRFGLTPLQFGEQPASSDLESVESIPTS
jgi:flagellar protein FlbD